MALVSRFVQTQSSQSNHCNKMKNFDFKNAETAGACWAIHLILTFLLAIGLAAYDGVEHTYPILAGYMSCGWIIPFSFWRTVKKIVSLPVSSTRLSINIYGPPIMGMVLGTLFFVLGVFVPASWVDYIKDNNGITIWNSDPRFAKELLKNRIETGGMGLSGVLICYFILRFIRKHDAKNQEQKPESEQ
jgi:hypothetical protein